MKFFLLLACTFSLLGSATPDPALSSVQSALGKDAGKFEVLRKPWKQVKNTEVFLAFLPTESPDENTQFKARLFLVSSSPSGQATILARGEVNPPRQKDSTYVESEFSLDLAPYRLTKDSVAMGVRFSFMTEFPAGQNVTELLHLFQINKESLVEVFRAPVSIEDTQRGPNDQSSMKATVSIDSKSKEKMRDILVAEKWKFGSVLEPENGPDPKKGECKGTLRFKWDGKQYLSPEQSCRDQRSTPAPRITNAPLEKK